ncbi:PP2C family protein-serine/threonine phosphatase [Sphingomonas sp. MMS12-HWE2-04]|uniref:PP2C family protein-serine/threonine phosphatase n=1 Tax=Sphingomonas sp. MMS12-HWE2-04 TaxID=3234199 RepID=UPI00384A5555
MKPACIPLSAELIEGGYQSVSRTHVGHVRRINEDRILDCPERSLWAIADGMGGHRGGDVAAEIAIASLRRVATGPAPICAAKILDALIGANREILERGRQANSTIGSTIVALHIDGDRATVFWAGDSRAYVESGGARRLATRDHSLVQELLDAGAISEAQAARHPKAHVITRALGVQADIEIASALIELKAGERLLLCSDGLSRTLAEQKVAANTEIGEHADALLSDALRLDGSDNISLVVIEIDTASASEASES